VKQRYIRPDAELTDDTVLVVRSGALDRALLEGDARRAHAVYGTNSLSVFAADGVTVDELDQEFPLVRFESFTLISVGTIKAAGSSLRPTGRNRLHHSIEFADLDDGVTRSHGSLVEFSGMMRLQTQRYVNASLLPLTLNEPPGLFSPQLSQMLF
jgi:hypothetical protein